MPVHCSPPLKSLSIMASLYPPVADGSLVVADVAPTIDEVVAFAMIAPPLGVASALFACRDVTSLAVQCSKPKLAIVGANDSFCSEKRFEEFRTELRGPSTAKVIRGNLLPCDHGGCGHAHFARVNHFNIFEYSRQYVSAWVEETFGCSVGELGTHSGTLSHRPLQSPEE